MYLSSRTAHEVTSFSAWSSPSKAHSLKNFEFQMAEFTDSTDKLDRPKATCYAKSFKGQY